VMCSSCRELYKDVILRTEDEEQDWMNGKTEMP